MKTGWTRAEILALPRVEIDSYVEELNAMYGGGKITIW